MKTNVHTIPFNTDKNALMMNAANSTLMAQQQPTQSFGFVNQNSNNFSNPSNINNQIPSITTFSNQQGNNFNTQQSFANNNQSGLFENKTSNNKGFGSNFGNKATQFNNNAFNTAPNSFIQNNFPTSYNMTNPSFSTSKKQSFLPRKPKNQKLDPKNLVKSISLLDQNNGLSLKQVRLKYINMQVSGNFGLITSVNSFGFGAQNTQNSTAGLNLNQNENKNIINGFNLNTSFQGNTGNNQQNNYGTFGANPALSANKQIGFNNNSINNTITNNNIVSPNNNIDNSPFGAKSAFTPAFGNSLSSNTNIYTTNIVNKTGFYDPKGNNSVFPSSQPTQPTQPTFGQNLTNTNNQFLSALNQNQLNSFGQTFANTVFNLDTSANTNLSSAQQAYNNNFFGSMPNYDQTKTELMLTNSLIQSDFFRDMIKSNLSHSDNTSQQFLTDKKTKNQRLFSLFDENQQDYAQDKLFCNSQFKKSKPIKSSIKEQKQLIKFYQKPYFFNESYSNYNRKARQQVLKHKFQAKQLPPQKNKPILQIFKQTPLTEFQKSYDILQKKLQKQFNTKNQDLPINDCGFKITPNIHKICSMSTNQIKEISNVTFQNAYGKISFLGPISLYRKKLSECIEINRDSVQVKDKDWQKVRCRVVQQNFGGYLETSQAQKKKFMKKMLRWADKNLLRILNFDNQTGEIIYQANF